jgi:Ca-activated chloride channel family protein
MSSTLESTSSFTPLNGRTGQELKLSLQELLLGGELLPVGARLRVRHTFRSAEERPVEVVYSFPLPRDAALRRFRILGEGFDVTSELRSTAEAVHLYEEGLAAGSLSTLARQYRDGLINLSVGNLRPGETVVIFLELLAGVELHDQSLRFRFPFTLAPCYHAQMRAIEVAPGEGELELPEEFGDVLLPQWVKDARQLHAVGFDLQVRLPGGEVEIGSPSHAIAVRPQGNGCFRVRLAPERDVPDRDLVLDVTARAPLSDVRGGLAQNHKAYYAVVLPSSTFGTSDVGPRRLVFVLDRSGSMSGVPLKQAKRGLLACLGALRTVDQFGLIAFDDRVEHLNPQLLPASSAHLQEARKFLEGIEARGGTEVLAGIQAALQMLGKQGGDVLVLTDGQVFGTETILNSIRTAGARLHCLGIGSSSQDRFLTLLARQTGGLSRFLTPRERLDEAALELFAGIGAPVARQLRVESVGEQSIQVQPEPPPAIFAGTPLLLFVEAGTPTAARLRLHWQDAAGQRRQLELPLNPAPSEDADTVRLLQGARRITDLEARLEEVPYSWGRSDSRQDRPTWKALEQLSRDYELASRAMSLVAVVRRKDDLAGDIPKTQVVPLGMPQDTAFAAYFPPSPVTVGARGGLIAGSTPPLRRKEYHQRPRSMVFYECPPAKPPAKYAKYQESVPDPLLRLIDRLEPDGGMPGKDDEERWLATVIVLAHVISQGYPSSAGFFQRWRRKLLSMMRKLRRMFRFLKASPLTAADPRKQQLVALLEQGQAPNAPWSMWADMLYRQGKVLPAQDFWNALAAVK